MAASNNAQTRTPEEELGRLDLVETRLSRLEESVNKAVGTLMPKVEALLSERDEEASSISSSAPTLGAPSSSLLELAERGDGEALLRVLAEEWIDIRNSPPRTRSGDTALHVAAGGGHLKAVLVLMGAGAPVDALGHRMRTPLHCAAAHGHLQVARHLLYTGAKVDMKDVDGATALKLAAGSGHCEIVRVLLQNGAPCKNGDGAKVLELATEKRFTEIVGLLVERGVEVDGKLASLAISQDNKCLVELFLNKGMSADACNGGEPLLVQAAKAMRREMVDLLLERGASPTKCKEDKECALVYASKGGQADAVRQLLRRGAATNPQQVKLALQDVTSAAVVWAFVDVVPDQVRGEAGRSGLYWAAYHCRLEPLVALLEAGVDSNSNDRSKKTALHYASQCGHAECVRELLGRGADANAEDNDAFTPLHLSSLKGHVECVRVLVGAGASATQENCDGKTPLDLAKTDEVRRVLNGQ